MPVSRPPSSRPAAARLECDSCAIRAGCAPGEHAHDQQGTGEWEHVRFEVGDRVIPQPPPESEGGESERDPAEVLARARGSEEPVLRDRDDQRRDAREHEHEPRVLGVHCGARQQCDDTHERGADLEWQALRGSHERREQRTRRDEQHRRDRGDAGEERLVEHEPRERVGDPADGWRNEHPSDDPLRCERASERQRRPQQQHASEEHRKDEADAGFGEEAVVGDEHRERDPAEQCADDRHRERRPERGTPVLFGEHPAERECERREHDDAERGQEVRDIDPVAEVEGERGDAERTDGDRGGEQPGATRHVDDREPRDEQQHDGDDRCDLPGGLRASPACGALEPAEEQAERDRDREHHPQAEPYGEHRALGEDERHDPGDRDDEPAGHDEPRRRQQRDAENRRTGDGCRNRHRPRNEPTGHGPHEGRKCCDSGDRDDRGDSTVGQRHERGRAGHRIGEHREQLLECGQHRWDERGRRHDGRGPGTDDRGPGCWHAASEPFERECDHRGRERGRDPQEVGILEAPCGELESASCGDRADPRDDAREPRRRCAAHEHDDVQQRDDGHDECGDGREPVVGRLGEWSGDRRDDEAEQGEPDRNVVFDAPTFREHGHERMHERADRESGEREPDASVGVELVTHAHGE